MKLYVAFLLLNSQRNITLQISLYLDVYTKNQLEPLHYDKPREHQT